jgi:hypothetical protein
MAFGGHIVKWALLLKFPNAALNKRMIRITGRGSPAAANFFVLPMNPVNSI